MCASSEEGSDEDEEGTPNGQADEEAPANGQADHDSDGSSSSSDSDSDSSDDEEEKQPPTKKQIALRAVALLVLGTAGCAIMSDPLVDAVSNFSTVCCALMDWK